jgi:putative ABC transport system permease protein
VLVAAMITVLAVRLYPLPVRAVARLALRSPGMYGLIGSVRARRAIAVLPLLALTLAIGLTTTNAFLGDTVAAGQRSASWERVGADARIDAPITKAQHDSLASADGVDAVSSLAQVTASRIEFGSTIGITTMFAVDDGFAGVLDGLPDPVDTSPLDGLRETGDEIPVLLDPVLAKRATKDSIVLTVGQQNVTLRIVGTFDAPLRGFTRGPFIYVPFDALNAELDDPLVAGTTLVVGAGTDAAIAAADIAPDSVLERSTWLHDQRELALVSGVQAGVGYSTLLVAALAIIAMLATVVAGTRDRARTLSLLRTLGTPARFGWWIALSDLAPLVAAALVGGIAAGSVIAGVLFRTMGLTALTGGSVSPAVTVGASSVVLIVVGAIALVLVSILVELVMHRRDRLNDVLRVGETV